MNLERKIRLKAALLYLVVASAMVLLITLFIGLRKNIDTERQRIVFHHHNLETIHKLIRMVNHTQSTSNLYISSRNSTYLSQFDLEIKSIQTTIETLKPANFTEKQKLAEISFLLKKQSYTLRGLKLFFSKENPVSLLNQKLHNYQAPTETKTKNISSTQDTILKLKKRNFISRLKEVFKPVTDSTLVIHQQQTIQLRSTDSPAIIPEIKQIAQRANTHYTHNIRQIEQQVDQLLITDSHLSQRISELLVDLHERSFKDIMKAVSETENSIRQNFSLSIIAGIAALSVMLLFIILIIYDINKGKKAREQIKQIMQSRHQLLLAVSHDIKTPLQAIQGYLELLEDQPQKLPMQNSVRHIRALLENLLEFSSMEQGKLTATISTVDLHQLSNELEQMFRPLAEGKKLRLQCNTDAVRIETDLIKLKQIAINLLSNSIKYTLHGEIKFSMHLSDNYLQLRITDTGVGIPENQIAELFKPFSRIAQNNIIAHGTGLGMYVVKGIVDLLGGKIEVQSTVNKGSEFNVVIPTHTQTSVVHSGETKKIAVYDDDPIMHQVVCEMLQKLGHKVVQEDFDIILTDMEMDKISGNDILKAWPDIPVVVMTGRNDLSYEKARQMGFVDYLAKPFDIESLRNLFGQASSMIEELTGDDEAEIREIFRTATLENFRILSEALTQQDFKKAHQLCHKMLPMFMLLQFPCEALKKMDLSRGKEYSGWEEDVASILTIKV